MKARNPVADVSNSSKATGLLMSVSPNEISELEAAYQTPKLWDSEEKKPTTEPTKSNTKLKELYLQRFRNVHNIQDSQSTPTSRSLSPVNELATKFGLQDSKQNDELFSENYLQLNPRQDGTVDKPSIKGRFEQFISRYSIPERQKSVPTLDFAPLTKRSPTTPTVESRAVSQLSIEELLALTSKRSDNILTVKMKQGENGFSAASKFSELNSMNDSYHNDTPSNPNKMTSKANFQSQAPQRLSPVSNELQAKKILEDNYRSRPISGEREKYQEQKITISPEKEARNRSNGSDPVQQTMDQRTFDAELKSKNMTISTLKKEYIKLLETLKRKEADRNREVKTLQAKLINVLEEKDKVQKDLENIRERFIIYEKSASNSESNRVKRELSHQVNISKCREISLKERLEKLEQSLKEEKTKNSKLNTSVLQWRARWDNSKRGSSNSKISANQLQVAVPSLENRMSLDRNDLFRDDSQSYATNDELQKLKASLNEMTVKLKETQNKVNHEQNKRVQLEQELKAANMKLSEQVKKSLSKNDEITLKSDVNNEEKLKAELILKDKELKRVLNELNEQKIWLEKTQGMLKLLKEEKEKAPNLQDSQSISTNPTPKDSRRTSFELNSSKEAPLEATLKDVQAREDTLRQELKERQSQIGNFTSKLSEQEDLPKNALELGSGQAQLKISDTEKQEFKMVLEKMAPKIKILAKHLDPDFVYDDGTKIEAILDQIITKVTALLAQHENIKSDLQTNAKHLLQSQTSCENLSKKCDELSKEVKLKEKEAEILKNSNEELSNGTLKMQKENQELLQSLKDMKSLEKNISSNTGDHINQQTIQALKQDLESKSQAIISLEDSQTQLQAKLAKALEELTLSREEIKKLLGSEESKNNFSLENEIEILKVELAKKEAQITQINELKKLKAGEANIADSFNDEKAKELEEINKKLELQLSESQSRITNFEHEIASMKDYISVLKSNQDSIIEDSNTKVSAANETITKLKEELKKSVLENETLISQKSQEIIALQNSFKETQKALEVAASKKEEALNQELLGLKNKIQGLELELGTREQSLRIANDNLKDQSTSRVIERDLQAASEEIEELNIKLKKYEDQISKITVQAEGDKTHYQQDRQVLLDKINSLKESEKRHAISIQEKDAVVLAQFQEVASLKEQISKHEAMLAALRQTSYTEADGLRVKLSESEARITQLLHQINEINSEKQQLSEQLSRSQEQILKLEEANAQQKQMSDNDLLIKTNNLRLQIIESEKKIAGLERELEAQREEKTQEIVPLTKLAHEVVTEESINHLNESLAQAEAIIQDLQSQITALLTKVSVGEEAAKQLEIQKTAFKQLEETKRTLLQENELLKAKVEENGQELAKIKKGRVEARKSVRSEENIAIFRLRDEIQAREEQILSLEKSNKSVKDHYELQLKNANATILELRSEQAKLRSGMGGTSIDKKAFLRAQEMEGMNIALKQQTEHFRFLFEDQEIRIKENEKQTKELAKKLQETEEEFEKLKHEQEETCEELEGLKTTLESHKKLLKNYQEQNKTLMAQNDDLTSKLTESETAVEHYLDEMKRYISKIEDGQNKEHILRQEYDALKKKKAGWKLF